MIARNGQYAESRRVQELLRWGIRQHGSANDVLTYFTSYTSGELLSCNADALRSLIMSYAGYSERAEFCTQSNEIATFLLDLILNNAQVKAAIEQDCSRECLRALAMCTDPQLDSLFETVLMNLANKKLVLDADATNDIYVNLMPTVRKIEALERAGFDVAAVASSLVVGAIKKNAPAPAVELLIKRGAKINTNEVCNALAVARSPVLTDLLVSKGFNLKHYGAKLVQNTSKPSYFNPLENQRRNDYLDYLINNSELVKQFKPGKQVLKIAVKQNNLVLVQLASRLMPAAKLDTSVELACAKGLYQIVEILLKRGAPVTQNAVSATFNMVQPRCLEILLKAGISIDGVNLRAVRHMINRLPESELRVTLETHLVAHELISS